MTDIIGTSRAGATAIDCRITGHMYRLFPRFGHDVCDWARVMMSCRAADLPSVRADRLRAAAEFRRMLRQ
jgi:hypothetical protein